MLLTHNTKSIKQNYDRRNTRAVRDREAAQLLFLFYPSGGAGRALAGAPACAFEKTNRHFSVIRESHSTLREFPSKLFMAMAQATSANLTCLRVGCKRHAPCAQCMEIRTEAAQFAKYTLGKPSSPSERTPPKLSMTWRRRR